MSVVEGPRAAGLVERVKNILLKPTETWGVIDGEPATVQGLYTGYACILAAIGPIASLIGGQIFGFGAFFISYHPPLISSIVGAVVGYVLSLAMVFVLALVIDALAPSFDGTKDRIQALKVATYASTAGWVGAIFGLIPALAVIGALCGLYGLYLLYLGLPKLMKAPAEKALGYTIVTIIVAIVLFAVVGAVVGGVTGAGLLGGGAARIANNGAAGRLSGTINLGNGSVDLGKLQAAGEQAAAQAKAIEANANGSVAAGGAAVTPVAGDVLKTYLPGGVNGYACDNVSAETASVGGIGGSNASTDCQKGDAHMTVKVTDMAGMAALGGLLNAVNIESNSSTADGYEKIGRVGGRMTTEKWNKSDKSGEYTVLVNERFAIEASGEGADMNDLKAAVAAVNPDKLQGLKG